jgi:hypothetical protein
MHSDGCPKTEESMADRSYKDAVSRIKNFYGKKDVEHRVARFAEELTSALKLSHNPNYWHEVIESAWKRSKDDVGRSS